MLSLFVRCIVIYFFLLVAMRLMGKRQLGELQPFEFAITLVASELACIPMGDPNIPIVYGIISVFTLFLVHIIITKLAVKSLRFRKVLNGKPVIVIERGNILPEIMKELNMNIDDLLEALRGNGYFNPAEVEYAIVETNGSMTVLPKSEAKPLTPADVKVGPLRSRRPVTAMMEPKSFAAIMEGNFMGANIAALDGIDKERILRLLASVDIEQKDVLLLLVAGDDVFVQPYKGDSMTVRFPVAPREEERHPPERISEGAK